MSYYAKRFFGQQGIVTDGLKLWLDASNPESYPGSGTIWYDLSGNGNNGTMFNGVIPVSNAMQFDGINDYVSVQNPISGNNISMSFWVKSFKTQLSAIYSARIAPGGPISSTLIYSQIRFDSVSDAWFTGYILPTNNYVHIAITQSTTKKTIFVNGVEFSSLSGIFGLADVHPLGFIGVLSTNGVPVSGYYFNGQINDIMLYSKPISLSENLQNYNATKSKYGL